MSETAKLWTELNLKDGLTGGLQKAQGALGRFSGDANKHFSQMGKGAGQLAGGIARIGAMGAGVAIGGLAAAAKATAGFGDQMNIINTIAQKTPEELAKIGDGIKGLSADTGAELSDLTGGYYDLLSAGIKVEDAQNALNLSYQLSRGSLSTTTEAVDFLTTAINSYGLSQKETAQTADMFAQAVADGKVKLSEIAGTFADVAPIASQYGIGLDEIAASYGMLTAKGNTAGAVTTQMNRAITELAKPGGPLLQLEGITKKSYIAIAGKEGLVTALQQMRVDAKAAGIPFIQLFGRQEAYKYAVQTTGKNLKDYNEQQERVRKSGGALADQVGERQQGLAFQFQRLKANVLLAGIAVGEGFAPALGRAADKLVLFIKDNKDELVQLGKDIGAALDGIDWAAVGSGTKTFLDLLKQGYDIIKLIPPEVAMIGAGFLGINKLSGGLIGSGLKNIGEGLLGTLGTGLARGIGGKVPGLNKLMAQPVYVTNWNEAGMGGLGGAAGAAGGGGVMGRIGGAVKLLGAVTIAGASIAALAEQFGIFQQTTAEAQASLQAKADAAKDQNAAAAIENLDKTVSHLAGLQGLDRMLADSFGGKQQIDALTNLSDAIVNNGELSTDEMTRAIGVLKRAQVEATARGNKSAADHIGRDIAKLQSRLTAGQSKTTMATNQLKTSMSQKQERQIGVLETIASQPTKISVTVPVSTSVSVRDVETTTRTASRYGFVAT